jgi:hypothetical protein
MLKQWDQYVVFQHVELYSFAFHKSAHYPGQN